MIHYPTGVERPTFDVDQQNSQQLLTSGGVLDGGNGDPRCYEFYIGMKYIIYTGRSA